MDNRPIGIFDSGVGGLTVAKHIFQKLPQESIIYVGDTARIPYGSRSPDTIIAYSTQITSFLINQNVKAIVVACSTASSLALKVLEKMSSVPVIGVINFSASSAAKITKSLHIAIIGTQGTIASQSWEKAIAQNNPNIHTVGIACPLLVPLIEEGIVTGPLIMRVLNMYLKSLKTSSVDTLILGCTHYPLIIDALDTYLGKKIQCVDPGLDTALELRHLLKTRKLGTQANQVKHLFYTTDNPKGFISVAAMFLGEPTINRTRQITL
jgi:glutamate racemase